ncbi:S8 family serine peptidase [Paenibacillus periandrae]|uniref:S8 family serine peptidase n=1 Tax=Paenibacillus periandrae TaxID=1761741 RepID=UPI001F097E01|nr:S8 family serine peptidase [Paenibacillus periandrae]
MFKKWLSSLLILTIMLSLATPLLAAPNTGLEDDVEIGYIVKFKDGTTGKQELRTMNKKTEKAFSNRLNAHATVRLKKADLAKLQQDPNVAYIEPDGYVHKTTDQMTPNLTQIRLPNVTDSVYGSVYGGKGVKIAVFDTGVSTSTEELRISGGASFVPNDPTYNDINGHGTHAAGIIAALKNDKGIVGIAPQADIYSVKVLDENGGGRYSWIISALEWAIDNHMDVVSMSFAGSQYSRALEEASQLAYDNGVLLIAATGNDGVNVVSYPAKLQPVIAVGAVDSYNQLASFSNTGNEVELVAPGVNVPSLDLSGRIISMSGTSSAVPHVVGVSALIKSQSSQINNKEIRNVLTKTAERLGANEQYGYGLLNASAALDLISHSTQSSNQQLNKQQLSAMYNTAEDWIQQWLDQGYTLEQVGQALQFKQDSGKSMEESLNHVAPGYAKPTTPANSSQQSSASPEPDAMQDYFVQATAQPESFYDPDAFSQVKVNADQAPYSVKNGNENISTLSGSLSLSNAEFHLPGRNGLSLTLQRMYDSSSSLYFELEAPKLYKCDCQVSFNGYYYTEKIKNNVVISQSNPIPYRFSYEDTYRLDADRRMDWIKSLAGQLFDVHTDSPDPSGTSTKYYNYVNTMDQLQPEVYVRYFGNDHTNFVQNDTFNLPDAEKIFHLGKGWRWNLPYLSIDKERGKKVYHTAEGASYEILVDTNGTGSLRDAQYTDLRYNGNIVHTLTGVTEEFDYTTGHITKIRDLNGNTISFTYSNDAKYGTVLSKIEDAIGNAIEITYTNSSVTIKQGDSIVTYNKTKSNTTASYPWQNIDHELLTEVVDPIGRKTQYTYMKKNGGFSLTYGGGANVDSALLTQIIHPTGGKTNYTYASDRKYLGGNYAGFSYIDSHVITSREDQMLTNNGNSEIKNHREFTIPVGPSDRNVYGDYTSSSSVCDGPSSNTCVNRTTYVYKRKYKAETSLIKSQSDYYNIQTSQFLNNTTELRTDKTYDETNRNPLPVTISQSVNGNDKATTTRTYNYLGQVTSETDALGRTAKYEYNFEGIPTSSLIPISATLNLYQSYVFDYRRQLTKSVARENNQEGKLLQQIDIPERDSYGNILKTVVKDDTRNIVTTREYSTDYQSGFPTKQSTYFINANNVGSYKVVQSEYEMLTGRMKNYRDGNGYKTSYSYDKLGRVVSVTHPDESVVKLEYNDSDNKITQTDETGKQTIVTWNPIGEKIQEGILDGTYKAKVKYGYDEYGRLQWMEDAEGNRTSYAYDNLSRQHYVMFPGGGQSEMRYDDANRMQTLIDPEGNGIRTTVDKLGQIIKSEEVRNSVITTLGSTEYNYAGKVVKQTDGKGKSTTYDYDTFGHLLSVTNPLLETTRYTYSMAGQLTELQYPDGNKLKKQYDELGRVIRTIDPMQLQHVYEYDGNGQMTRHQDPKGQVFKQTYNNRGFLTKMEAPDETQDYTYDAAGRRTSMKDATGTTGYSYKANSKELETVTYPDGKTIGYAYDSRGNRSSTRDPFQNTNYSFYDQRNRLQAVSTSSDRNVTGAYEGSYSYFNNNLLKTIQQPGSLTSYTYEGVKLQTLTQNSGGGTNQYTYGYDGNQNMNSINGTLGARNPSAPFQESFTYDDVNRIATASQSIQGQTPNPLQESYTYTNRGNRETMQTNRGVNISGDQYVYDSLNRLKQVIKDGGSTISYSYNGDGLMVARTENGDTTKYYYDGNQIIAEGSASGAFKARTVRGLGLLARQDNVAKGYYLSNGHGDVTELRSSTGSLLNAYTYDLWGNTLSTQEGMSNPFRYSSEYWDTSSQLQYLRARWYDPSMGRFINKDTYEGDISNPLSLNGYTYVENNPLSNIDPTGHMAVSSASVIGSLVEPIVATGGAAVDGAVTGASRAGLAGAITGLVVGGLFGNPTTVGGDLSDLPITHSRKDPIDIPIPIAATLTEENNRQRKILYHYTDQLGYKGILSSGVIFNSTKALRPKDARFGDGVYLTDIAPDTMSKEELSQILYNNAFQTKKTDWYVAIDVTDLNVYYGRPGVYVYRTEAPLPIINRFVTSGYNSGASSGPSGP